MAASVNQQLGKKISRRQAVVGVLGLGYVGLPLALRFAQAGVKTIGFDIDAAKVGTLAKGRSYINYIPDAAIRQGLAAGFVATGDFARAADCDALIICVPTPLNKQREPDLSYIVNTTRAIAPFLKRGQLV